MTVHEIILNRLQLDADCALEHYMYLDSNHVQVYVKSGLNFFIL